MPHEPVIERHPVSAKIKLEPAEKLWDDLAHLQQCYSLTLAYPRAHTELLLVNHLQAFAYRHLRACARRSCALVAPCRPPATAVGGRHPGRLV